MKNKIKVGDYVKLKPWTMIDKEDRWIKGVNLLVSNNPGNIRWYDAVTRYKVKEITYNGDVLFLMFPTAGYSQSVLLKDILTEIDELEMKGVLNSKQESPQITKRLIRGRVEHKNVEEVSPASPKLRTFTINKGKTILLEFGGDSPIKVCLDNCTCYEDKKTKNQVIEITGLVIPKEKVFIRKIRG